MKMHWLLVLIIILFAVSAGAQDTRKPDERLNQKVSYTALYVQLQKVCDDLTLMTGVTIKAGFTTRDWKSKERLVSVNFNNLTLKNIIYGIADSLHMHCGILDASETETKYVIWSDLKSRKYEELLVISQKNEGNEALKNARKSILDNLAKLEKLTPEQLEKLKEKSPDLYNIATSDKGKAYIKIMSNLEGENRQNYLDGKDFILKYNEMPKELQLAIYTYTENGRFTEGFYQYKTKKTSGSYLDLFDITELYFYPDNPDKDGKYMINVNDVGAFFCNGKAKEEAKEECEKYEFRNINREMINFETIYTIPDVDDFLFDKSATDVDNKIDKELLIEVGPYAFEKYGNRTERLLTKINNDYKISFIMEHYPLYVNNYIPDMPKSPLFQILDRLKNANLEWEYKNNILMMRPYDWAAQRAYDVPENIIATLERKLNEKGMVDWNDLCGATVNLTEQQICYGIANNHRLFTNQFNFSLGGMFIEGSMFLRLYVSLNQEQKSAMESESGLAFERLNENQWEILTKLMTDDLSLDIIEKGFIQLVITEEDPKIPADKLKVIEPAQKNKRYTFRISAFSPDKQEPTIISSEILIPCPAENKYELEMRNNNIKECKKREEERQLEMDKEKEAQKSN